MIRSPLLTASLLATLPLALAPGAHARDARLATRLYNANEVVRIDGRSGVQATITFADDEHIENVAIGDSTTWQVTPNKRANLLFVKPLAARARTNMTVVTDRHTYLFDLVASPAGIPIYVLRFTYPEVKKASQTAIPVALTPEETQVSAGAKPVDPADLNFAWKSRGVPKLLPSRIYDDGHSTYVTWQAGTPVPAILIRDEKGVEGPVNYAVRDDVLVLEGVPKLIVLRLGKDSATLENAGPPRIPAAPSAALAAATPVQPQGQ